MRANLVVVAGEHGRHVPRGVQPPEHLVVVPGQRVVVAHPRAHLSATMPLASWKECEPGGSDIVATHEHANEQASLDAHLLQQMQLPLQVFLVEVQHLSATITISLAS